MVGFEIAEKMDALTAYQQFPEQRLQIRMDGQLTGNIIIGPDGRQHELDDHNSDNHKGVRDLKVMKEFPWDASPGLDKNQWE